jgi:rhamnose transport system permease protein
LITLREKIAPFTHEIVLVLVLVALMVTAGQLEPRFVSSRAQQGLLSHVWDLALLSLPMTFIIITGGIDLSVGSMMALTSVTLGKLYAADHQMWQAILAALAVGIACGLLNGIFITMVRVHPLIVTLATYSAYRGLAEGLSLPEIYSGFPKWFTALGQNTYGSLQLIGWLFIVAAVICAIVLAKTPFGRSIYAIGFNETAARFSGLKVNRAKLVIYTLSGLAAAIVSINYSALRDNAQASVGNGMELDVITAVVLGGTSIFGGRGRILGTILGVALIHETREFVGWHYHRSEYVPLVLGALLIVAVATNALLIRRSSRT